MKALSVIVASQNAETTIEKCLSSLQLQNRDNGTEIIVVDNSTDRSAQIAEKKFPDVQLIKIPDPRLIPELWAVGLARASGEVVATTTAHCIPDAQWISEVLRQHESTYAGIGGAIENVQPASPIHWAVYFCRYTPYMLPFSPHPVEQIPGDNGSYKRWVLEECANLIKDGFWETVVNAQLRKDGHSLLLTPMLRVYHGRSFGLWTFCRQRLLLGRIFGAERASTASFTRRLVYIAFSPLIPFVFLGKIVRQVINKGRHQREFLLSLPALVLFVLCWSLGEFLGYLQGISRTVNHAAGTGKPNSMVRH